MANNANVSVSYHLRNFRPLLDSVIARAEAALAKGKLKVEVQNTIRDNNFIGKFQIGNPSTEERTMTIGELCDSGKTDTVAQAIDPKAVEQVLFGRYGLIQKSGGGRFPYLMEDIEVGFIYDPIAGTSVGPSITSGRNRTLALQILLAAAGLSEAAIENVKLRVRVVSVRTPAELQARIISANVGSREFSRAEIRERTGCSEGLTLVNRDTIRESIPFATNEAAFKAAMGAWLKDVAHQRGLNSLTPAQYSDAGTSVWNKLSKKLRPGGGTLYSWVKSDTTHFLSLAALMENNLERALELTLTDSTAGAKSGKLAEHLTSSIHPALALTTAAVAA